MAVCGLAGARAALAEPTTLMLVRLPRLGCAVTLAEAEAIERTKD